MSATTSSAAAFSATASSSGAAYSADHPWSDRGVFYVLKLRPPPTFLVAVVGNLMHFAFVHELLSDSTSELLLHFYTLLGGLPCLVNLEAGCFEYYTLNQSHTIWFIMES